jgi:hypothetical protein
MKLSASTRGELEEFFREFLGDANLRLPPVRIHAGRAAGWLTRRAGIDAITLGHRVFVAPHHLRRARVDASVMSGRLLAHEVAHLLQAARVGLATFLFAYLREYLRGMRRAARWDSAAHWRAYSEISFEREAREAERAYVAWRARG